MSNPITDVRKTNLLFKQFMGVAATQIGGSFTSEGYSFVPNIFSKDVMIEEIPDIPPPTTIQSYDFIIILSKMI